jgi:hypothetical protein
LIERERMMEEMHEHDRGRGRETEREAAYVVHVVVAVAKGVCTSIQVTDFSQRQTA